MRKKDNSPVQGESIAEKCQCPLESLVKHRGLLADAERDLDRDGKQMYYCKKHKQTRKGK